VKSLPFRLLLVRYNSQLHDQHAVRLCPEDDVHRLASELNAPYYDDGDLSRSLFVEIQLCG
jgi:hypothetical protein